MINTSWSQQYLPFTVLKLTDLVNPRSSLTIESQQYLPFTVLKPYIIQGKLHK